jgi:hypothetical protein
MELFRQDVKDLCDREKWARRGPGIPDILAVITKHHALFRASGQEQMYWARLLDFDIYPYNASRYILRSVLGLPSWRLEGQSAENRCEYINACQQLIDLTFEDNEDGYTINDIESSDSSIPDQRSYFLKR